MNEAYIVIQYCCVSPLPWLIKPCVLFVVCCCFPLPSIAAESDRNLMKASNLGVVFGPTLMRPERETVATIVNIKYQNIVVEIMIEEMDTVRPHIMSS